MTSSLRTNIPPIQRFLASSLWNVFYNLFIPYSINKSKSKFVFMCIDMSLRFYEIEKREFGRDHYKRTSMTFHGIS